MQSVVVCHACGRTIDKEFLYCPWCGTPLAKNDACSGVIDSACARLEAVQSLGRNRRIDRLESTLQQLEEDLSLLISRQRDR